MNRLQIKTIILIIIAAILLAIFSWLIFAKKTVEFDWRDINNQIISSKQTENKLTLVNYWATWCPPCVKEMPAFNDFQKKYPNQVQILGISYDQIEQEKIRKFINNWAIDYPIIIYHHNDLKMFKQITGLPTTIVLYNNHYNKTHTGELSQTDLENFYQQYRDQYPRKN